MALLLAWLIGFFLALPQLWATWRYYPQSIRAQQTATDKQVVGSLPLRALILRMGTLQRLTWVDGVAPSEMHCYPGIVLLIGAFLCPLSAWHGILLLAMLLSLGRHTPVFQWTHRLHLRIPVRYTALVNLSLIVLGIGGWSSIVISETGGWLLLVGVAGEALLRYPSLSPSVPYCQRWMKPSTALSQPVVQFLQIHQRGFCASGLPYPHRTGLLAQVKTLGYNGGSQPQWMATLRQDTNPLGSGAHDWFLGATSEDTALLDAYGVKYLYTTRSLPSPRYRPTPVPHLYRNTRVRTPVPTWDDLAHGRSLRSA